MSIEKYGVEDRVGPLKEELDDIKKKLSEKTASEDSLKHLEKRKADIEETLKSLA